MVWLASNSLDEFNGIRTLKGPTGELATKLTDWGMAAPSFSRA